MDLKTLKNTPPWNWPKGASQMFLEILGDDRADESERLLAAELAGDFTAINDELAGALLSIVRNGESPEKLRAKAAISLGPALETAETEGFDDDATPISEATFRGIHECLHKLHMDTDVPKEVRRRVLEASVRAPQDWHQDAVRAAYSSGEEGWTLTAVFSMRWIRGFDDQIFEALKSGDPEIHYEAVCAAGNWGVDAAWSHIAALVASKRTEKALRLAAIEAVAGLRPAEAAMLLVDLTGSGDEDIAEAAYEAMAMAEGLEGAEFDDDGDPDGFVH